MIEVAATPREARQQILREVLCKHGMTEDEFFGPTRPRYFTAARAEAAQRLDATGMSVPRIAEFLQLEKSSVSRMVRKLIECGELKEQADAEDARIKPLSLTPKGRRTLVAIVDFARRQVSSALERLTETERRTVREGLAIYARALEADRIAETDLMLLPIA